MPDCHGKPLAHLLRPWEHDASHPWEIKNPGNAGVFFMPTQEDQAAFSSVAMSITKR